MTLSTSDISRLQDRLRQACRCPECVEAGVAADTNIRVSLGPPIWIEIGDVLPERLVALRIDRERDQAVISELRIMPKGKLPPTEIGHPSPEDTRPPRGGLTAGDMGRVKLGALRKRVLGELRYLLGTDPNDPGLFQWLVSDGSAEPRPHELAEAISQYDPAVSVPGKRRTLKEWSEIAVLYSALCQQGHTHPHKELAAQLGVTEANSRKLIFRCREKGLLLGGEQGKAGGYASAKALRTLGLESPN